MSNSDKHHYDTVEFSAKCLLYHNQSPEFGSNGVNIECQNINIVFYTTLHKDTLVNI